MLRLASRDGEFEQRRREATRTGRPWGRDDFIGQLERETDGSLRPQKRGPKPEPEIAAARWISTLGRLSPKAVAESREQ